ncbi:MAG: 50S ribosomal protein L32 [Kiritimatiellae bacterium]|nr:50S ribosomal protein L32 [Kiritimatiellia bacterium]
MAVPKRKSSKRKIRSRKGSHKKNIVSAQACPNCGASQESHRVCKSCGYYRGRQVVSVEAD